MSHRQDFDEFYLASWSRVLRATYGVTLDLPRAEDAAQSAFAKAYASWSRVSQADDPLAYVRRMAFHDALSHRRLAFRRRESSTDVLPEGRAADDVGAAENRLDLWDALRALPPRQRAVIVLRYYEDLSEAEIAATLGIRPGTVKSQASAALATLRRGLGEPVPSASEGERR